MSRLHQRFAASLLLVLLVCLATVSWHAGSSAERLLLPEIASKADTVGRSAASLINRALGHGIPLDRLEGVAPFLAHMLADNAELSFIALYDTATGRRLDAAGAAPASLTALPQPLLSVQDQATPVVVRHPVGAPGGPVGTLVVAVDPGFARATVARIWLDLAIVLLVTALVALELVSICFGTGAYAAIEGLEQRLQSLRRGSLRCHPPVDDPTELGRLAAALDRSLAGLRGRFDQLRARLRTAGGPSKVGLALEERRDDPVADSPLAIRALVFLFMFADELNRPFLPTFVRSVTEPVAGWSLEFVISLPLVLFMAIVALSQIFLGGFTRRYGHGRALMAGAAFGIAGHLLAALAGDLTAVLIARAITAAGFALVFVAGQGFVIDSTTSETRSRGLAVFVGAILVAGVCGPPVGGIIADQLGFRAAFATGAAINAAGFAMGFAVLPRGRGRAGGGPGFSWRAMRLLLTCPRAAALFFGCALPAKLILSAFSFFLIPVEMEALGYDQAAIGRTLMLYPLAMVLLVPPFSGLADRYLRRRPVMVALGGVLAGACALYAPLAGHGWWIAMIPLQLGIAQALSIGAQAAMVGGLGATLPGAVDETTVYGVFRLIERSGNALGPALAGLLLGLLGFPAAMLVIGAVVVLGALVFYLVGRVAPTAMEP